MQSKQGWVKSFPSFAGEASSEESEQIWCLRLVPRRGRLAIVSLLAGVDALYFPFLGLTSESTTEEVVCNRTRELKENDESKERLVAASIVLGAGEQYEGVDSCWGLCGETRAAACWAVLLPSWACLTRCGPG